MRLLGFVLGASMLVAGCGSSKNSSEVNNDNPSIKETFRSQMELAMASFDTSAVRVAEKKSNLEYSERELINNQIRRMRDIVPLEGFTQLRILNDEHFEENGWRFKSAIGYVRLQTIQIWLYCQNKVIYLRPDTYMGHNLSVQVANTYDWTGRIDAQVRSNYYASNIGDIYRADFSLPSRFWNTPECVERKRLEYLVYSDKTHFALERFRSELSLVLADMDEFGRHTETNYPYEFTLRQIKARLNRAFEALP